MQKPNDCGLKDDGTPSAACVNHWTLTAQLVEVAALLVGAAIKLKLMGGPQ